MEDRWVDGGWSYGVNNTRAAMRMPSGIQSRKVLVHRLWVRVVYHSPEDLPELVEATSSVNTAPIPEDSLHDRVAFEAQLLQSNVGVLHLLAERRQLL